MDAFPGCFCKSVVRENDFYGKRARITRPASFPDTEAPAGGRVSASDRSEIIAAAQVGLRRLSLRPSEPPVRPHNIFAGFGPLMRIPTFRQALAMKRPEQSGSGQTASGPVRKSTPRRSESRESDRRDGCRRSHPPLRSHDRNRYVRRPNAAYFHGSCR